MERGKEKEKNLYHKKSILKIKIKKFFFFSHRLIYPAQKILADVNLAAIKSRIPTSTVLEQVKVREVSGVVALSRSGCLPPPRPAPARSGIHAGLVSGGVSE